MAFRLVAVGTKKYLNSNLMTSMVMRQTITIRFSFYNHDWSPSTLFKNEFLDGFDNLRIDNYTTSFNTLTNLYPLPDLEFPNDDIQFKVSGNYVLEVYSSEDELAFSRRFCIYDPQRWQVYKQVSFDPQNMDRFSTRINPFILPLPLS